MDFTLPPEIDDLRRRVHAFVADEIVPLEADPASYDEHENIALPLLETLRAKVKSAGLWAPQAPKEAGGLGLGPVALAALYEEMGRSIFGPVAFNCAAPDDGNMILLAKVAGPDQQRRWLDPIVEGRVRSAFAMTEPMPGAGSDPSAMRTRAERKGDRWIVNGRKWFITGAGLARHFILIARTSDDDRKGLTAFLFERERPGWSIVRRIPVMGPEEHGGHCELVFDGLEIPDEDRLMAVGDGLKVTQIRLGTARLTHCMRWLGMAKRALEIAGAYVSERESFGSRLKDHEGVQWLLGEAAMAIEVGRLLTMKAAWKLEQGDFARPEVSMAKIQVADALHKAIDTAIQLTGARGYSKDTPLEWMYRYARQARLVDGASEIHKMVLARSYLGLGADFWGLAVSLTERSAEIARFVAKQAGARDVRVTRLEPLSGGAVQENWALDAEIVGGAHAGAHRLVLRTDAPTRVAASHGRAEEFALLKAAWGAGVATPEPLWLCEDAGLLGRPFFLMRRLDGVAASHRLTRDPGFALDRPKLMDRLAEELAKIHGIRPPHDDLVFLTVPAPSPAMVRIAACRRYLDGLAEPRPALEYGLRWAERHAPPAGEIVLTHQDFRTGNYLVDAGGLVAILDWEFAEWGDPLEDIGWFCAKCWRCGVSDREAGGIGDREDFVRAYERHSGRRVDQTLVRFWEVMAHLRWAVIALLQAKRHLSGGERSLELALTGRIVCELELEALRMIEAADPTRGAA